VGNYPEAAAGLNSLLAAAPGMDWTTMSGLYGNTDDYTSQFRRLEQFCQSNPNDASSHFVLAYHYLVTGSKDGAIDALRVVVKNQPKDATAKRMLDAMVPAEAPSAPVSRAASTAPQNADAPETDLVGLWTAAAGDTKIELTITEDSMFTWKTASAGKESASLEGNLIASSDGIELQTAEQGSMAGTVESRGSDAWLFRIEGAPASDPGLAFARAQ
jgi:hypothetical protein